MRKAGPGINTWTGLICMNAVELSASYSNTEAQVIDVYRRVRDLAGDLESCNVSAS